MDFFFINRSILISTGEHQRWKSLLERSYNNAFEKGGSGSTGNYLLLGYMTVLLMRDASVGSLGKHINSSVRYPCSKWRCHNDLGSIGCPGGFNVAANEAINVTTHGQQAV